MPGFHGRNRSLLAVRSWWVNLGFLVQSTDLAEHWMALWQMAFLATGFPGTHVSFPQQEGNGWWIRITRSGCVAWAPNSGRRTKGFWIWDQRIFALHVANSQQIMWRVHAVVRNIPAILFLPSIELEEEK